MLVCLCHPTSDSEIRAHVEEGARSAEEIGMRCGAGTGCGACVCQIEEMIEDVVEGAAAPLAATFAEKSARSDCSRRLVPLRSRPHSSREAA